MNTRFFNCAIQLSCLLVLFASAVMSQASLGTEKRPNIVLIMADDLGYGELGCYGQALIRTPNLDRLAKSGIKFTRAYSGSTVCAPSRCVLMTGKHTGHAEIRGNTESGGWGPEFPEGQRPISDEAVTLAEILKAQGYSTCAVGKWGLGGPGTTGHPNFQGFDHWYGYLCQRIAHNYYPTHLWRNHDVDVQHGNRFFKAHQRIKEVPKNPEDWNKYSGEDYACDSMTEELLNWVKGRKKAEPYFLYWPTPVPHVSLQVPEDSLAEYSNRFDETPYLGHKGYLPHPKPRAAYAAMITRMDRDIGKLLDLIEKRGERDNTLIIFTSDNGATFNGGSDRAFFHSNGPLRAGKTTLFDGGVRVPLIANWPSQIKPGQVSTGLAAAEDIFATIVDVVKASPPKDTDGQSFLPVLLNQAPTTRRESVYIEYVGRGGVQTVITKRWKAIRKNLKKGPIKSMLFDLRHDEGERTNVAKDHPEVLARLLAEMDKQHTPSATYPFKALDQH